MQGDEFRLGGSILRDYRASAGISAGKLNRQVQSPGEIIRKFSVCKILFEATTENVLKFPPNIDFLATPPGARTQVTKPVDFMFNS